MTEEIRIIIEALQEAFGAAWGFGESIYPLVLREFVFFKVFENLMFVSILSAVVTFILAIFAFFGFDNIKGSKTLLILGCVSTVLAVSFSVLQLMFAPNYSLFMALLR